MISQVKKIYYTRRYAELKSPMFQDMEINQFLSHAKSFSQQYRLGLSFSDLLGWKQKPAKFSHNRQVHESGIQIHNNSAVDGADFFSGSTGWGWGVHQHEDLVAEVLASKLDLKFRNHSQVAFDLYKIYRQIQALFMREKLADKVYIYLGVNESFLHSQKALFDESPRAARVARNLNYFERYYYAASLPFLYVVKSQLRAFKNKWKNILKPGGASAQKELTAWDDHLYFKQMGYLLGEIKKMSSEVHLILEPNLFHKKHLSSFEKSLLDHYARSNPRLSGSVDRVYAEITRMGHSLGMKVLDLTACIGENKEDLFWDYCHPSPKLAAVISNYLKQNH